MKRFLPLLLALCLILAGCGNPESEITDAATTEPTTEPVTEAPTTEPPATEPVTTPPVTEPEGVPSPLTGELMPEASENRPFAVTINNIVDAMPQWGVSKADILYEVLAEGGVTRSLAIFHDVEAVGPLGSIRSARPCMLDLAMAYDAIYVHAGGSQDAYSDLRSSGWDHIDGVQGANAYSYFYRDQDRLSMGYSLEHTLFITGEDVVTYARERGCDMTRTGGVNYGLCFAQDATPAGGTTARTVTVDFANSSKTTKFTYDAATGLYAAEQYGRDYIDAGTGLQLTFRNLIVITADTSYDSDGYRLYYDLTDSGEGWFACGGKMVPILWSRTEKEEPFVYTLTDGTPLTLGVGTTYIAVTPYGSEMICE